MTTSDYGLMVAITSNKQGKGHTKETQIKDEQVKDNETGKTPLTANVAVRKTIIDILVLSDCFCKKQMTQNISTTILHPAPLA